MAQPHTKIHCTCGPACRSDGVLDDLIEAGADVFRVNAALADESETAEWIRLIREASARGGRQVGVMVDLPGPKFRLGPLDSAEDLKLGEGHEIDLDLRPEPGNPNRLGLQGSMPYLADVATGAHVLLGDGTGRLEVLAADAERLRLRVIEPAVVRGGMGVHFVGVSLPTSVPTRRDRALLRAAVEAGADMVAQSFVRTADDMGRLQEQLRDLGARHTLAIAKIERLDAFHSLDGILARSDGLIVGRGDLGNDAGPEHVPSLQRRILEAARLAAVPVVIATEMLGAMVSGHRPTRAEVSDVAGAVFGGADGVMLTTETARGRDPARAVRALAEILRAAEADPGAPYGGETSFPPLPTRAGRPDQHVVRAAVGLAHETEAVAIVVFTRRGASARRLSKERPAAEIRAFAPTDEVCRRLTLAWGVRPQRLPFSPATDEIFQFVRDSLYGPGGLGPRDRAVLVMGCAEDPAGTTTLIKLFSP